MGRYGKKKKMLLFLAGSIFFSLTGKTAMAADLSLKEAVNLALAQNTALKITQRDEISAKAELAKAKGNNNVAVTASDSLTTQKNNDSERSDSNNLGLTASVPLYTGGKNQAAIKKAELGVEAADLTTERERENLKLSVIKAYYDSLEARKTIAVRQETVDKYQEHYTNVNALYSAGSKARIDVIRSSVELSDARQELIKAQNSYEVKLASLRNYLNINRNESLNLTTDFTYDAFKIDMDSCIEYAYRNRKDLLVDANKLAQQEQNLKAAKAGNLPTLKLSVGANQINAFSPASNSRQGLSAGAALSWNIFDSGVTKAEIKAAENNLDIAKLNLQKDKENVDLAVRQAYYSMREAEKRFNSTKDAVKQAEEDAYIAREKYRAGEGLMLDIIDAQEALAKAKLNFISAQYDYARYKATVENAMGIGLSLDEQTVAVKKASTADVRSNVADNSIESADEVVAAMAGNEESK